MASRGEFTLSKLSEARFFLEQLAPNFKKERKFDYYLSAFIGAARSVTWVMRKEYGRVPGWSAWFDALEPTREESALLRGTNKVRIRTTKLGNLQTRSKLEVDGISIPEEVKRRLIDALAQTPGRRVEAFVGGTKGKHYIELRFESGQIRLPVSNVIIERTLDEFPGQDILTVCSNYYNALASLVRKCREKFDA